MNIWHDMRQKNYPESFIAVIEISKGSKRNTSWTKRPFDFRPHSLHFDPLSANYGFILQDLQGPRPLDVRFCSEELEPLSMVNAIRSAYPND